MKKVKKVARKVIAKKKKLPAKRLVKKAKFFTKKVKKSKPRPPKVAKKKSPKKIKKHKKAIKKVKPIKKVKKLVEKPKRRKIVKILKKKPARKRVKKVKNIRVEKAKPKKIVHRKPVPVRRLPSEADSLQKSLFKPKIRVIGIGGGGASIVSEIGRSLDKASFVIADTDARNFKSRKGIRSLLFGQSITHGLGTGLNPQLGREGAEAEKESISELFEGQDLVIFVASLGGGVGSGSTPIFAEVSKDFDAVSLGIFTLPFKFEGKNKQKIALKALRDLRESLNVSIALSNERIFKVINPNTAITEAFSTVNKSLIESLESLIDLIYNPGIINIDFADLRTILGGRGNLAFLNTIQVSGKDKIEEIKKSLLENPLYQSSHFPVQRILFNIQGGKNMSMVDVDRISKIIAEQNPKAKIIFGISKNSKSANRIKITVLMVGSSLEKKREAAVAQTKSLPEKPAAPKKAARIKKKQKVTIQIPSIELVPISSALAVADPIKIVANEGSGEVVAVKSSKSKKGKAATIRRTALEIKKDQELKESEKSEQEKEWEIPAFLRLKNKGS